MSTVDKSDEKVVIDISAMEEDESDDDTLPFVPDFDEDFKFHNQVMLDFILVWKCLIHTFKIRHVVRTKIANSLSKSLIGKGIPLTVEILKDGPWAQNYETKRVVIKRFFVFWLILVITSVEVKRQVFLNFYYLNLLLVHLDMKGLVLIWM